MESLKQEIENEVKLWLSKRFKSIDKVVQQLKALLSAPTTTTSSTLDVKTVESATAVVEKAPHVDISVNVLSTEDPHMYKKYAEKLAKTDFVKVKGSEPFHVHVEYTSKNEKNAKQVVPSAQVNHMAKEQPLAVQSNNAFSDGGLRAAHGLSAGAGVAIAIGALAFVFITIGVGYILTKKIKTEAYLEVSVQDPITVEDKHIARMQTGYENPTYKLIERTEA